MKNDQELRANRGSEDIGRVFKAQFSGLFVDVLVNDVKFAYGNKRYLVSVAGQASNLIWVNAPDKPKFNDNAKKS